MSTESDSPVLVTGATGYVAGLLVQKLLLEGKTVHATVRNPNNKEKLKYLKSMSQGLPGKLIFFEADLLKENSFNIAMDGCSIVFHTASPFAVNVENPQIDLINPAKLGTQNVLTSVNKISSVKRVVLTSSCVAMYSDNIDLINIENGILTEDHWNTNSSLEHNPYAFSKTLAEKLAWQISSQQNRWDLITINPSLVMGPGINPNATSESYRILKQFAHGMFKWGVPDWGVGIVDVRNVAEAHYRAAYTLSAKGRYIVSGHDSSFPEVARILRDNYGRQYPISKTISPKWLVSLLGPLTNKYLTKKTISLNVGYKWKSDNTKSVRDLGLNYIPLETTVVDFFSNLIEHKVI